MRDINQELANRAAAGLPPFRKMAFLPSPFGAVSLIEASAVKADDGNFYQELVRDGTPEVFQIVSYAELTEKMGVTP